MKRIAWLVAALVAATLAPGSPAAGILEFDGTTEIVTSGHWTNAHQTAAEFLAHEVNVRTGARWRIGGSEMGPLVKLEIDPSLPAEGYRIHAAVRSTAEAAGPARLDQSDAVQHDKPGRFGRVPTGELEPVVLIKGADTRGLLYGVGHFLRKMEWGPGRVWIPDDLAAEESPDASIRGFHETYTNTPNSYDAWSPEQYETYIREQIIFGMNSLENVVPLYSNGATDGGPDQVHMKLHPRRMNVELSRIAEKYDLDFWLDTAVKYDLDDEDYKHRLLAELDSIYAECPRISHIFIPGGDPGHNHPRLLLPFLSELAEVLRRHHPDAGVWFSLQKYDAEMAEYTCRYLEHEEPEWLTGIVIGPWAPSYQEHRERIPSRYRIRRYPDATHNVRCEIPVPWWDPALAFTLNREAPNPRPVHMAAAQDRYAGFADGFIAYSEGIHDDVNKIAWSGRAWDGEADLRGLLVDYSRFFFGSDAAERAADGILALEQNWQGPLCHNGAVEGTLRLFQRLEREHPELTESWRWNLLTLRAHYDAYVRRRLLVENDAERRAMVSLVYADEIGVNTAIDHALFILHKAQESPAPELRQRILDLCDTLWEQIGFQTSVELHRARGPERGAVRDFVDLPCERRLVAGGRVRTYPRHGEPRQSASATGDASHVGASAGRELL